tara:strand:+ start:673 stop:1398 length:726 start_codon:yes stop_codon:yes gene_type:complete
MKIKREQIDTDDWGVFQKGSIEAYKAYLEGDKSLLTHHNIISDGILEIDFILKLCNLYLDSEPSGKALDIGCGSGYLTDTLYEQGFSSTGFDLSEEAIRIAKQKFPERSKYFVGDGARPADYFETEKFDLIIAREFHPFTRINDPDFQMDLIESYLNLLNSGGVMVIAHSERVDYLDTALVNEWANSNGFHTVGPYHFSLLKRLKFLPRTQLTISCISILNSLMSFLLNKKYVGFFLIQIP